MIRSRSQVCSMFTRPVHDTHLLPTFCVCYINTTLKCESRRMTHKYDDDDDELVLCVVIWKKYTIAILLLFRMTM